MSIECSECERDLRGGHDPTCSRYRGAVEDEEIGPVLTAAEDALIKQRDKWRARAESLSHQLEADRSTVAVGITTALKEIASRSWLSTGRGSYEWDDDRYRDEFKAAADGIIAALEPLRRIAADWTGCPKTTAEVAQARIDWRARAERLEAVVKDVQAWIDHPQSRDLSWDAVAGQLEDKVRAALKKDR